MKISLFVGGLAGLAIGAVTGWLAFGSVGSGIGIGIGIAFGAAVCGVLIAYGHEQSK